jgi:DNA-binding XRE family transcriptional regulator
VGKAYDEIIAARRARSATEAEVWAEGFAESYDIAAKVMALRLERGLTQEDLAARAGIDQADISRIERGATSPTWKTLQRVLAALDARLEIHSNI